MRAIFTTLFTKVSGVYQDLLTSRPNLGRRLAKELFLSSSLLFISIFSILNSNHFLNLYFNSLPFLFHREWLTPNALQQSIAIQNQDRDSDTSPL